MGPDRLPATGALLARAALTLTRGGRGDLEPAGLTRRFETTLDPAWLAAYAGYFGGFMRPVPVTAIFPAAQRAHLALMLDRRFPYAVPGMVHAAEALSLEGAIAPDVPLVLDAAVRPMPEAPGLRLALEVVFFQQERRVAVSRSVYVVRRGGGGARTGEPPEAIEGAHEEAWALGADEGRRYARLSGDYNPIHLYPWTARAFGFARPILHGMDAASRVVASVERGTGACVGAIEVRFKRPVALPAAVRLQWREDGCFAIEGDEGVRHLEGGFISA